MHISGVNKNIKGVGGFSFSVVASNGQQILGLIRRNITFRYKLGDHIVRRI